MDGRPVAYCGIAWLEYCYQLFRWEVQASKSPRFIFFFKHDRRHEDKVRHFIRHILLPPSSSNRCVSPVNRLSTRDTGAEKAPVPLSPTRDRLQIAVTISSSVLQLHGSPWLVQATLTSRDIFTSSSTATAKWPCCVRAPSW